MTTVELTMGASLGKRIVAWMDERFPFFHLVPSFTMYLTCAVVARFIHSDGAIVLVPWDILGGLITWSFFLLLRVFDEHKDYQIDCHNHPQRVLQSGLITLDHLKLLGGMAMAAQLGMCIALDGGIGNVFFSWLILLIYTLLMGKEFFCGEWLQKRLTLYAVSHMFVMFLVIWWLFNLAVPGIVFSTTLMSPLMLLAFVSGFCFEITRKTRAPEEERETVDSYSKIFGTEGAVCIVLGLMTAMVMNQAYLVSIIATEIPWIALSFLLLAYLYGFYQIAQFFKIPSEKGRESNEKSIALTMFIGYVAVISVVLAERGVQFIFI